MASTLNTGKRRYQPKGRQVDGHAVDAVEALLRQRLKSAPLRRDRLLDALHALQDARGHIDAQAIAALAQLMGLAQADVFEVATFYAHFDVVGDDAPPPPALSVRICDGVACQAAGADGVAKGLIGALGDGVRVVRAPCVGGCHTAPMAVVGRNRIGAASRDGVLAAVLQDRTRTVVPDYADLDAYRASGGYARLGQVLDDTMSRDVILEELDTSGLRGLGGAGFPVANKWRFLDGQAKPRCVVVNADEGEPGTFKDHHILTTNPHQMLDGALIAAHVVEAEDVYIYLRDEYADARAILEAEIEKLEASGLTLGLRVHLRRGAGSYVCGEESALLESLEGKRGLPRNRPPYPAEAGLFGRPTLINNVETLYWVADIARRGGQAYADAGRPRFYSVSGRVADPGVKLAPSGTTTRQLIETHAGGMADGHTLAAFLPGGASGGLFPAAMADEPLDFGVFEAHGGFIGSAAVVVLSQADDLADVVRNLVDFFVHESCGQCTPCRVGCDKLRMLTEPEDWNAELIEELAQVMRDGSICGLGQAAPNPVLTWLKYFGGVTS